VDPLLHRAALHHTSSYRRLRFQLTARKGEEEEGGKRCLTYRILRDSLAGPLLVNKIEDVPLAHSKEEGGKGKEEKQIPGFQFLECRQWATSFYLFKKEEEEGG